MIVELEVRQRDKREDQVKRLLLPSTISQPSGKKMSPTVNMNKLINNPEEVPKNGNIYVEAQCSAPVPVAVSTLPEEAQTGTD